MSNRQPEPGLLSSINMGNNTGPAHEVRQQPVTITIWKRWVNGSPQYDVTRKRAYRDKNGDWSDTQTMDPVTLPLAWQLEQEAFQWIREDRKAWEFNQRQNAGGANG